MSCDVRFEEDAGEGSSIVSSLGGTTATTTTAGDEHNAGFPAWMLELESEGTHFMQTDARWVLVDSSSAGGEGCKIVCGSRFFGTCPQCKEANLEDDELKRKELRHRGGSWQSEVQPALASALTKVTYAACRYDRIRDGIVVRGMQGQSMPPDLFKVQLKRAFNVRLTKAELAAIMLMFDSDGDGSVDSGEFLTKFCQLSFAEKSRQILERRKMDRLKFERMKTEEAAKIKAAEEAAALKMDTNFGGNDKEVAMKMIEVAARKYDRGAPGCVGTEAFDGASMTPAVFREQLKRVFNIKLTPKQLGAVVEHFDKDGDGTVDCAEFLISFFRTGFQARTNQLREWRARQARLDELARQERVAKQRAIEEKLSFKVSHDFSEEHLKNALKKVTFASCNYDRNRGVKLAAFEGANMTPVVLKEQLKRAFNIRLNPPELGAVVQHFDKDGDGTVDCAEFLNVFFKLGRDERSRHLEKQHQKRLKEINRCRVQSLLERKEYADQLEARRHDFDDCVIFTAIEKITKAVTKFNRCSFWPGVLQKFDSERIRPEVFRELMREIFNCAVSYQEVGALMNEFEKEKKKRGRYGKPINKTDPSDTHVDGKEFLRTFFDFGVEDPTPIRVMTPQLLRQATSQRSARALERRPKESTLVRPLTGPGSSRALLRERAMMKRVAIFQDKWKEGLDTETEEIRDEATLASMRDGNMVPQLREGSVVVARKAMVTYAKKRRDSLIEHHDVRRITLQNIDTLNKEEKALEKERRMRETEIDNDGVLLPPSKDGGDETPEDDEASQGSVHLRRAKEQLSASGMRKIKSFTPPKKRQKRLTAGERASLNSKIKALKREGGAQSKSLHGHASTLRPRPNTVATGSSSAGRKVGGRGGAGWSGPLLNDVDFHDKDGICFPGIEGPGRSRPRTTPGQKSCVVMPIAGDTVVLQPPWSPVVLLATAGPLSPSPKCRKEFVY